MSSNAYATLESVTPSRGPELREGAESAPALCHQCLVTHLQRTLDADARGAQCQAVLALLSSTDEDDILAGNSGFYVSKPWLTYALAFFCIL